MGNHPPPPPPPDTGSNGGGGNPIAASLFPYESHNDPSSNFSFILNAYYQERGQTITISDMQFANRGARSILAGVSINGDEVYSNDVYMPTDGSYTPIEGGGVYNGEHALTVDITVVSIISSGDGYFRFPYKVQISLPSVSDFTSPLGTQDD